MKSKWIMSALILLNCLNVLGMEKDKAISSLLQNKQDHKSNQNLGKELKECDICHQHNAQYRHPDVRGFMCNDCSNKRALFVLDMVLGPVDGYWDWGKEKK